MLLLAAPSSGHREGHRAVFGTWMELCMGLSRILFESLYAHDFLAHNDFVCCAIRGHTAKPLIEDKFHSPLNGFSAFHVVAFTEAQPNCAPASDSLRNKQCVCFLWNYSNQQIVLMGMTTYILLRSCDLRFDIIHGFERIPCGPVPVPEFSVRLRG